MRSRDYNDNLRYQTIRHAMLGQLRRPPVGFEDVVQQHFATLSTAIMAQCKQWTDEAVSKVRLMSACFTMSCACGIVLMTG
eukprot:SAG31_NODE_1262_length_9072_cov_11.697760_8_plen_81_part_00